jgi:tRNA threonylcarbamoyl adenosine modification protein (Sua5/YciO/YrdC/YwlC family)
METRVLKIRPENPDLDLLAEAAAALRSGKLVVFPTETVYGLGALSRYARSVEKIYDLKGRERTKHVTWHVSNFRFLNLLKLKELRALRYLARKFWPGPLTIVVPAEDGKTYGFRMPDHAIARLLIELCGDPILATSANKSGRLSPVTVEQALKELGGEIELAIDGGPCSVGADSTVADLTERPFRIGRQGPRAGEVRAVLEEIEAGKLAKFKILFVCTGNTCRSPMAQYWLAHEIKKRGFSGQFEVESCGVFAYKNMPATPETQTILRDEGIDMSAHAARPLTQELVKEADQIYTMTGEHERFILHRFPHLSGIVKVLDVEDPIGLSLSVYRDCFSHIRKKLAKEMNFLEDCLL